jgi:diguanylate cyclase (GGDEF)-like protein
MILINSINRQVVARVPPVPGEGQGTLPTSQVAPGETIEAWLTSSQARQAIDLLLASGRRESVVEAYEWPGRDPSCGPVHVSLIRLRGSIGDLLLITANVPRVNDWEATDALTGLSDRRGIVAWTRRALQREQDESCFVALLFLDLVGFKQVNDTYGHALGDAVLCELSVRWHKCLRAHDLVARYGGDEFVVLLDDVSSRSSVAPIVERLTAATGIPIVAKAKTVTVGVTIGVALGDLREISIDRLIEQADSDMYRIRHSRENLPR